MLEPAQIRNAYLEMGRVTLERESSRLLTVRSEFRKEVRCRNRAETPMAMEDRVKFVCGTRQNHLTQAESRRGSSSLRPYGEEVG